MDGKIVKLAVLGVDQRSYYYPLLLYMEIELYPDIPIFCITKVMALSGENERFVKVWNAHPQQQSLLQQTKF